MIILDSNPIRAARSLDDRALTKLVPELQYELEIAQKLASPRSAETAWIKQNIKWFKKYAWACAKETQYRYGESFPVPKTVLGPVRRPHYAPDGIRTFHQYISDTKQDYRPGKKKHWTKRWPPQWMSHRKKRLAARPSSESPYDTVINKYQHKVKDLAFSGTRKNMTDKQRFAAKKIIREITPQYVHHGCCTGSDELIHEFCLRGLKTGKFHETTRKHIIVIPKIVGYPPTNKMHRMYIDKEQFAKLSPPADYLARNRDIINHSQLLVATPHIPKPPVNAETSGTWYTINYARTKNIPTIVIKPDGEVEWTD